MVEWESMVDQSEQLSLEIENIWAKQSEQKTHIQVYFVHLGNERRRRH